MSTAEPDTDRFNGIIPPDPLLQSGCFIDPAASNGETLIKESEQPSSDGETFQASGRGSVASPQPSAPKRSSNGEKAATPAPESSETKKRRRLSIGERRVAAGETPDWLPPGWIVEDRVRASGATAGSIDKYYCDPVSGHVFRSKKEVLYYLENGTRRKKSSDNSESEAMGTPGEGSHKKKATAAPLNFDFTNPPEKVTWTLSDSTKGSWTPYMDGKKVAESASREWAAAFKFLSVRKR